MKSITKTTMATTVFSTLFLGSFFAGGQEAAPPPSDTTQKEEPPASGEKNNVSPTPKKQTRSATARPRSSQPTPAEIIEAFERDRPTNTPVRPRQWGGREKHSGGSGSRSEALLREGEFIHGKVGRIQRDGVWWVFRFESDESGTAQPPMRILPNQQLERLIMDVTASAESPVFVISGEITLFEESNYVLLRKVLKRRAQSNLKK